jgi:hypothetical protein
MARSQTWTRNVSKKKQTPPAGAAGKARGVVGDGALEEFKRRAEDLGLILHARPGAKGKGGGRKGRGGK